MQGFVSELLKPRSPGMLRRDFSTHFALKHMHKDLRLMGELAEETGTALPITKAIEQLFDASAEKGKSELDYSSILQFLEEASQTPSG